MSTYTLLLPDVIDTIKDSQVDKTLADRFIRLAEYKLERDLAMKGSVPWPMLKRLEDTANSDSTFDLPGDMIRVRTVQAGGNDMRYVAPHHVPSGANGYADAEVVLTYYAQLPRLYEGLGGNDTNWAIQAAYDAYLYGACLQYVIWGQEAEAAPAFAGPYADAVQSLRDAYGKPETTGRKAPRYQGKYTIEGSDPVGRLRFA